VPGAGAGARHGDLTALRRHLFLTEGRPEGSDDDAPVVWYLGDDEFYFRNEGAGLLLCGCDETPMPPCDVRAEGEAAAELADKLNEIAPRLAELPIARSWAGLRTFTRDRRPYIGWDRQQPWLFWVAGLGGHGATGSYAVGHEAAKAIAERL
jgi:glycine/D-amino acid oxidase-like deaminating enzyme